MRYVERSSEISCRQILPECLCLPETCVPVKLLVTVQE
jgi:hypothetical protein